MPSPILIVGDSYLSQKNVAGAKKKYNQYKWITFSAKANSLDEIRTVAGQGDFLSSKKVILIKDLPNQKAVREFLLDIVQLSSDKLKFIIWDSEGTIKIDPKKKSFNKTWTDFINKFKTNKNHRFVNNGAAFTEKESGDCIKFVKTRFEKAKRLISTDNAILLSEIVGKERGFLDSEITKLLLTCPREVTKEFIIDNAYPSSSDAVIYKFGNVLDTYSYGQSIIMMQQFLDLGINSNVLADLMVRKGRWQLVAASLWRQGLPWSEIIKKMMQMGKYPSKIWHDKGLTPTEKRKASESLKDIEDRMHYMHKIGGLPDWLIDSSKKTVRAESMPMEFMAQLAINSLKKNVVTPNANLMGERELKLKTEDRCIRVYLHLLEKLKEIRYGSTPQQDLQDMVSAITSRNL